MTPAGGDPANSTASIAMMGREQMGIIPAQTQLSTALAINLGAEGRSVSQETSKVTFSVRTNFLSASRRNQLVYVKRHHHQIRPHFRRGHFRRRMSRPPPQRCREQRSRTHLSAQGHPSGLAHQSHGGLQEQPTLPRVWTDATAAQVLDVLQIGGGGGRGCAYASGIGFFQGFKNLNRIWTFSVKFLCIQVNDRPARLALWLNQNFLMGDELEVPDGQRINVTFSALRHKDQTLLIEMETNGTVTLRSDNMDLCGDIIQTLGDYLGNFSTWLWITWHIWIKIISGLEDLTSNADFPEEISTLENLMGKAEELQSVRQRLSAEMADHSGMIRTLIVRAEDSRLMMDM